MKGVRQVFHVAADYRLWAKNPRKFTRATWKARGALLEIAAREGVERIVYTSTVATIAVPDHRGANALPNEETHATLDEMIGHYKRSKFLAELEATKAAAAGVPVVIVNPTTPVGPGDWKPTPTGRIIVDFLNGKMPAYVDTGLNVADVEDVAAGHLLAAERGTDRRALYPGRPQYDAQADSRRALGDYGAPAPRVRLPHAVALAAGYADEWFSRLVGREPQIPVEGVKMSRHRMFVESDKAERELGYRSGPVEAALERAVRWYETCWLCRRARSRAHDCGARAGSIGFCIENSGHFRAGN